MKIAISNKMIGHYCPACNEEKDTRLVTVSRRGEILCGFRFCDDHLKQLGKTICFLYEFEDEKAGKRLYTREVLIQIIEEALNNKQRPEESDEFSFWTDLLSYLKGGDPE